MFVFPNRAVGLSAADYEAQLDEHHRAEYERAERNRQEAEKRMKREQEKALSMQKRLEGAMSKVVAVGCALIQYSHVLAMP